MTQKITPLKKDKLRFTIYTLLLTFFITNAQQTNGELVPFQKIYPGPADSQTIRGDMIVIGNSILGILGTNTRTGSTDFLPNDEYSGTASNNGVTRAYIDIDSDSNFDTHFSSELSAAERNYSGIINEWGSPINPNNTDSGTFSSSAAELTLASNNSKVVKAYLYWAGIYPNETLDNSVLSDEIILNRPDCDNCEFYTDIKILPPNATEYVNIKYANTGNDHNSLKSNVIFDGLAGRPYSFSDTDILSELNQSYVCKADITPLFQNLQQNGEAIVGAWTIGNVRATTGTRNNGSGSGWSLVVIYEDPNSTVLKDIFLFDGYANVAPAGNTTEFNISGIETIPFGPVNVDVATIALEGDFGLRNDAFQINDQTDNGQKSDDWVSLSYPGADANNFYDSSIYSKGEITRYPNSSNTLGYDSDHFNIDNPGNEYIGNSDTEADFRLATAGDQYQVFFNAFAFERTDIDTINIDPMLNSFGGECDDEVHFTITGVPFTITGPIMFQASFSINGVITELPLGESSITINRFVGESFLVQGIVTVVDSLGNSLGGPFLTETQNITFTDLQAQFSIIQAAECEDEDPFDNFDPTVAVISVEATHNLPNYLFNLIDISNNTVIQTSNFIADNAYVFNNVVPGVYLIRIYSNGDQSPTSNCSTELFVAVNTPDCPTLSTNDNQLNGGQISMYPSPVKNDFTISGKDLISFNAIKIVSLKGEVLFENTKLTNEMNIDLSNFSSGLYLVVLSNKEGSVVKKILKY